MPTTPAQALTNLLSDLSHIFGNIVGALGGVLQAFIALFWTLIGSVVGVGRAIATAAIDLTQTTVGFIWGKPFPSSTQLANLLLQQGISSSSRSSAGVTTSGPSASLSRAAGQ